MAQDGTRLKNVSACLLTVAVFGRFDRCTVTGRLAFGLDERPLNILAYLFSPSGIFMSIASALSMFFRLQDANLGKVLGLAHCLPGRDEKNRSALCCQPPQSS